MGTVRLASLLAVGVVLVAARAEAQFESRSNASVCLNQTSWSYQLTDGLVNGTGGNSSVICPFVDDTTSFLRFTPLPVIRNINSLNVHGNKNGAGGTVAASACVKRFGSNAFVCGTSATATAAGQYSIAPSRTEWRNNFGDFAYLQIDLTAGSSVSGWWVST